MTEREERVQLALLKRKYGEGLTRSQSRIVAYIQTSSVCGQNLPVPRAAVFSADDLRGALVAPW